MRQPKPRDMEVNETLKNKVRWLLTEGLLTRLEVKMTFNLSDDQLNEIMLGF